MSFVCFWPELAQNRKTVEHFNKSDSHPKVPKIDRIADQFDKPQIKAEFQH
jgi:hypothetical protein